MSSATSAAPGAAGAAGAAAPPAAKPIKVVRKEGETAEERRARHAEKKRKVGEHRAEILRRLNAQTGRSRLHKQENFVCPVVFDNTLPPPPVDAKMLVVPLDDDAFISYDMINGVSSEQGFLHQLHADPGLGVPINLVETSQMFTLPPEQRPPMHELDAEITSERYARPAARKNDTMTAEPMVEWMMRGTHMHLDLYDAVYKHADSEKIQQLRLEHRRAAHAAGSKGTRRERIDASFKAVAPDQPVVHPTNKALQPRRVWEVLPAPQAWALNHVLVAFDSDPDPIAPGLAAAAAPAGAGGATTAAAAKRARLEGALIRTPAQMRPVNVAERTVRVDYLLPEDGQMDSSSASSSSSAAAAGGGAGAAARSLRGVRTYHMAVEPADRSKGDEQYVLLWDDSEGSVLFAPIRARAALTRVAGAAAGEGGDGTSSSSSSVAAGAGAGIAPVSLRERPALPEEQDAALQASATLMDAATAAEWRAEAARRREARRQEGIAQAEAARVGAGGSSSATGTASAGAASQQGSSSAAPAAALNGGATVSGVKRRAPDAAGEDEAAFADD